MKAKTIKKLLNKKHNEFINSIEDEEVRKLVKNNSIITGGAITSMLLNEPVNDFDYYFTDKETTIKVAQYFVDKYNSDEQENQRMKVIEGPMEQELVRDNPIDLTGRVRVIIPSSGIEGSPENLEHEDNTIPEHVYASSKLEDKDSDSGEEEGKLYKPTFFTSNAISLTGKIQLILRFYGDPEEIHSNYDFIHATCFWRSKDNHLELPQEALEAILTKELRYEGSKYPLASIFRTRKFIERGWTINAGQYLKMVLQLNEMDLTNVYLLEEQLTGVDFAYFHQIIREIKNKKMKDKDFQLTNYYLMGVINKIFD